MPLLPLDTFRKHLGWNPLHFWGLAGAKLAPVNSECITLISEHGYQNAYAIGRTEIRQAIETAERKIMDYLEFPIAPMYVEETVNWPSFYGRNTWRQLPFNDDLKRVEVRLKYGTIQAVGVETFTDFSPDAAVTMQDLDGDGFNETFQVTVATVETDPSKIMVFVPTAFRTADRPLDRKRWRIQPVTVVIASGTATITGFAWTIVKPKKYEGFAYVYLDPTDPLNFLTTLTLSVRSIDPDGATLDDSQGVMLWNTDVLSMSHDPAAIGMTTARVGISDAELGRVMPAGAKFDATTGLWDGSCLPSYREPDRVLVRYQAGKPLDSNGEMDYDLQVAVTRMAVAELGRPACGCESANVLFYEWQFDLSRGGGRAVETFQISPTDLANPFGTKRGHVWAWKRVKDLKLVRGFAP